MTKKNKVLAIRLLISIILWIVAIILEKTLNSDLEYIYVIIYVLAYLIAGHDILLGAVRNILNGNLLDEFFLMSIASIGAFSMRFLGEAEYLEAVAVMVFFQIGEMFQGIAVEKSRNAIMNTMELKVTKCTYSDGTEVNPEDVKIGDEIIVKPGEMVPLDGIATSCGSVNTASLTGEPLDVDVSVGDVILSGSINTNTPLTICVNKEFSNSTANKILDMVENATMRKAKSENFITKFAHIYTPIVVLLAVILAVIPPTIIGFLNGFSANIYKNFVYAALTCLVVSCPCALVVSVPLTYFAGIGANARKKIIVKGGSYLEDLALTDTIILDKTGTLTKASFEITNVIGGEEVLKIAKGLEINSTHPLAMAIKKVDIDYYNFDISEAPGYGIVGKLGDEEYVCGSKKLLNRMNIDAINIEETGSILYVAKNSKCIGAVVLQDIVKDEAIENISLLKKMGKRIIVLSGDTKSSVEAVCNKLGINEFYYGLLPQDKVMKAEEIINSNMTKKVMFVGDGINDAPVLAMANIGVSMGQIGSDSAIEASDVVILNDNLKALPDMLFIAKKTKKIVLQNIVFTISIKVIVLLLCLLSNIPSINFKIPIGLAIFADVGVCVIAIINAMRALRISNKK